MALHKVDRGHVEVLHAPGKDDHGTVRTCQGPVCDPPKFVINMPIKEDPETWPYYWVCHPLYWDDELPE